MAENNEHEWTLWQAKLYSGFAVERDLYASVQTVGLDGQLPRLKFE